MKRPTLRVIAAEALKKHIKNFDLDQFSGLNRRETNLVRHHVETYQIRINKILNKAVTNKNIKKV